MEKLNIAVLISGSGTNLQALIDAVECGDIRANLSLVVSNRKNAYGLKRAENAGIKTFHLANKDEDFDHRLLDLLQKEEIDLVVLAGYLRMIDKSLVEAYRNKIINIHPSLLPAFGGKGYYGIRVHERVYEKGCKVSGCTTHFVDEDTDTGPIILQKAVDIGELAGPGEIQDRVLEEEHKLLVETVKLFVEDRLILEDKRVKIRSN